MSTTTPRMYFPEIAASQAQKEVTHNESLQMLDCFTFCAVQDKDQVNPPTTSNGVSYIVAVGGASTWSGHDNSIAQYYNSAWNYYTPGEGWRAWIKDEDLMYVYTGSIWTPLVPLSHKVQAITVSSSTVSIDWTAGHIATMTLETVKDIAITFSGAAEGDKLTLRIKQGTTGGGTVSWPTSIRYGVDIAAITLSTAANKQDYVGLIYDGSTGKYDVVAVVRQY